jgi:hypothetical protein
MLLPLLSILLLLLLLLVAAIMLLLFLLCEQSTRHGVVFSNRCMRKLSCTYSASKLLLLALLVRPGCLSRRAAQVSSSMSRSPSS